MGLLLKRKRQTVSNPIVEVDVFADMMSVALNLQDKSWRGIYEKFLLSAMMSQTSLTVLGGLWI